MEIIPRQTRRKPIPPRTNASQTNASQTNASQTNASQTNTSWKRLREKIVNNRLAKDPTPGSTNHGRY
jgi:hypothetical protein